MAAGNFGSCLPYTLREEGGFSNDPRDPGGRTMHGVTQRTYDKYRSERSLSTQDVKLILDSEMQALYRIEYWDAIGAEALRAGEDLSAFDLAVNSGPALARKILKGARVGDPCVKVVVNNIATERLRFLHSLSTWRAFSMGWSKRVARIEAASLAMARLPIIPSAQGAAKKSRSSKYRAGGCAAIGMAAGAIVAPMIQAGLSWWVLVLILIPTAVGIVLALRNASLHSQQAATSAFAAEKAKLSPAKAVIAGPAAESTAGSPQPLAPAPAPIQQAAPAK